MEPKFSNLDADIDAGVRAMRGEEVSPLVAENVLMAIRRPTAPPKRTLGLAVRVAGFAGTAAAIALATWPRPGQGLAWAQVVARTNSNPRVHERTEMLVKGKWLHFGERWVDGDRYALELWWRGRLEGDFRFDGVRSYRQMGTRPYAAVSKVSAETRSSYTSSLLGGFQSIQDFLEREHADSVGKTDAKLPDGTPVVRYELRIRPFVKNIRPSFDHMYAYADPVKGRIVRWESLTRDGKVAQRGVLEYPAAIDAARFRPPTEINIPFFDLDAGRAKVEAIVKKGIARISAGGESATVRAVLLDTQNNLTVLWSGASPNGDLKPPVLVDGVASQPYAYGIRQFTTSRGLDSSRYEPSAIGQPLGGMTLKLKGRVPDRLTLRIPVFKTDKSRPVRNKQGEVSGYRSRFVGYAPLASVKPFRITTIYDYATSVGIHHAK